MNAPVVQHLRKTNAAYLSIRNTGEDTDDPLANVTEEQKASVCRIRIRPHLVKLIGVAVLAVALIATLTGIPVGSPNTEAMDNMSSNEQKATSLDVDSPSGSLNQGRAGYSTKEQMEIQEESSKATSAKVGRPTGFLNQGRAGYSMKEQMELLEEFVAARAPKADWPAGFLNQGRAGYSIKEQMEILEETTGAIPTHR